MHVPAATNHENAAGAFPNERLVSHPALAASDGIAAQKAIPVIPANPGMPATSAPIPPGHEKFLPETAPDLPEKQLEAQAETKLNSRPGAEVPGLYAPAKKRINELYPDRSDEYRKEIALPDEEISLRQTSTHLPPSIQKSAVQQLLQKPAFVAALLLVVIAAALAAIMLNNSADKTPAMVQHTPVVPTPEPTGATASDEANEQQPIAHTVEEENNSRPAPVPVTPPEIQHPVTAKKAEDKVQEPTLPPISGRKNSFENNNIDDYAKKEVAIDKKEKKTWKYEEIPATTENGVRAKTTRNETTPTTTEETPQQQPVVKTAAVALGSPVFTKGTLGGMYDISIPVKNNSSNKIDLVVVEVKYIKANGEVLQTKKLSLDHLLPGEQYTLKAPDSPRGMKLSCAVSLVTAGSGISMVQQ
ncbi:MAG: hypothetical protein ACO1NW_17095 [Chitinophagaceae bacterium]